MENLYCITGILEASKQFSTSEAGQETFAAELKELHIPESIDLVTEENIFSLLSQRVASHCLRNVFNAIISAYNQLGYAYSEKCFSCGMICH